LPDSYLKKISKNLDFAQDFVADTNTTGKGISDWLIGLDY